MQSSDTPADDAHPTSFAGSAIRQIQDSELYRVLRQGHISGQYITIDGRRLINLCSNDYLGLGGPMPKSSPRAQDGTHKTSADCSHEGPCPAPVRSGSTPQMQSSSRLLSGSDPAHARLEDKLASSKSYESALLYPTGYMANAGVIPVLAGRYERGSDACSRDHNCNRRAKKHCTIFSDELNHASIIEGCRLAADAQIVIYRHNDAADLDAKVSKDADACKDPHTHRTIIVTEGVFSMDGDIAPLQNISNIARRHNAILVVDDAHGDFVLGRDGRGTPDHLGLCNPQNGVHVYTSSLSKGLGSFGGYIAADSAVIQLCINRSNPFIYTSALPAHIAQHAYKRACAYDTLEEQRGLLAKNTKMLAEAVVSAGYAAESKTHILPVVIGDEERAMGLARHMYKNGIYIPAIRYPTVPRGKARLRISATAWLKEKDIRTVRQILESAPHTA